MTFIWDYVCRVRVCSIGILVSLDPLSNVFPASTEHLCIETKTPTKTLLVHSQLSGFVFFFFAAFLFNQVIGSVATPSQWNFKLEGIGSDSLFSFRTGPKLIKYLLFLKLWYLWISYWIFYSCLLFSESLLPFYLNIWASEEKEEKNTPVTSALQSLQNLQMPWSLIRVDLSKCFTVSCTFSQIFV